MVVQVGSYTLFGELGRGGMGAVHLARFVGESGFSCVVAVKRIHCATSEVPDFNRLADEARVAGRIRHANTVRILDVVQEDGGAIALVMEYVHGLALHELSARAADLHQSVPPRIAAAIVRDVLHGLHTAHEATDARGQPMGLVHRDVSPHNILVGIDGLSRIADFGIAKVKGAIRTTAEGAVKGKLGYMAPEQLAGFHVSRRSDLYSTAVVLWELLVGQRLFHGETQAEFVANAARGVVVPPSIVDPNVPEPLDGIVMRALARDPTARFPTALEMALALERVQEIASASEVGEWVTTTGGDLIAVRGRALAEIEAMGTSQITSSRSRDGSKEASVTLPPTGKVRGATRRRRFVVLVLVLASVAAALVAGAPRSSEPFGRPRVEQQTTVESERAAPSASINDEQPVPVASAPASAHTPPTATGKRIGAPSRPRCSPPWVWDSAGRKVFRAECFR